ncbi:c-type cytochrome [Sphingosinicella microcystinivorans]|nr:cytochrome c family protein [Sphingosinicella microcystinivorans]
MRSAGTALVALSVFVSLPAYAGGDAAAGAAVFKRCAICHSVDPGKKTAMGPNLSGVVGRKAGTGEFNYSPAMKDSGIVWTSEKLDAFLLKPAATVKGTRMAFAGLPQPNDRANVIAYLATRK